MFYTEEMSEPEVAEAILQSAVKARHEILKKRIAAVGVAGTGLQLALQLRNAARSSPDGKWFDSRNTSQMFVVTDGGEPATTPEEMNDPAKHDPYQALWAIAKTAVLLTQQTCSAW